MEINIWVGSLAKYNGGSLVGKWISLPMDSDELTEEINAILGWDEEMYIGDYEAPFKIDIYDNPHFINDLADQLQKVDEDTVKMLHEHYYPDLKECAYIAQNGDYTVLTNITSLRDLAETLVDEYDYLGEVPANLRPYLDWDAIIGSIETDTSWKYDAALKKAINLWD